MTNANEKQVGGNHYQSTYQHWDYATEIGMPYIIGCATKYLARWRKKGGVEDLKKAIHYVEKAAELNIGVQGSTNALRLTELFISKNLNEDVVTTVILRTILSGNYPVAVQLLTKLIDDSTPKPVEAAAPAKEKKAS